MKLTFHADGGHAWLKVSNKNILKSGIKNEISRCSYMTNTHTYLEEDCDAELYLKYCELNGIEVELVQKYSNKSSSIRSYRPYLKSLLVGIKVGDSIELVEHGTFKVTSEKKGRWILDGGLWGVSKRSATKMLLSIA